MLTTILLSISHVANASESVTFGGSGHYPPFHFYDKNGAAAGYDVDVFREIADVSDWEVHFRLEDWETVLQALLDGDIDVVPMFESDQRSSQYLFSNPINVEYHLVFGPEGSPSFGTIASLSGYRIAAENGAFATDQLSRQNPEATVIAADSEAAALQLIVAGYADFALLPAAIGRHAIAELQLDGMVALSPAMLPATYAFAVNPARPELLPPINRTLEMMQRNNTLESLRRQWLYPEEAMTLSEALRGTFWIVLPLTLLTGLLAAAFWLSRGEKSRMMRLMESREHLLISTQNQIRRFHNQDPLTGLPNRKRFKSYVKQRLARSAARKQPLAVGIMTLLNVHTIQDVIDDDAGDELIKNFARIIEETVTADHAYLAPDQFAFLIEDISSDQEAFERMQAIMNHMSQDLTVAGMTVHTQVCGGLALCPDHADNENDLLQKAKLAAINARSTGAQLLFFSASMKPDPQKLQLMSDLKTTLATDKLQWALQPQYDVATNQIMGAEILVRWHHAEYGWVPPSDFVVWAEQTGIIGEITDAAINHACSLINRLPGRPDSFGLSVNLSANDLADSAMVERIVAQTGGYADRLTLEITETALMRDMKTVVANVEVLKRAGIKLSLDDYGTGYSSLEYLKAFSFDEIKIDRMFINDIARIDRNLKLTQASIQLGHNLGAKVVAEGVEDRECADILIGLGCDVLQGYYIGRPQVPTDFEEYLRESARFTI